MRKDKTVKECALYVHIPFCDHKCIYCDFYSLTSLQGVTNYLGALTQEIISYSDIYSKDRVFSSIFFGGGTPSLMDPEYIGDIIRCLKNYYATTDNMEITLETNPGTVGKEKLEKFRKEGINRLSIGIQSFNNEELKFLTRIHDADLAEQTVKNAAEVGFDNISIDLMFNLPGQTRAKWLSNLQKAVELPVKHISAYSLIIEEGTKLNHMVRDGIVKMNKGDYDAEIYELTIDFLRKYKFNQYEVSNYAKNGYECRHNLAYWNYREYLSFGTSSHSFMEGKRWWNVSSLSKYLKMIHIAGNAVDGYEDLTKDQMLSEFVMLALRSNGLDTKQVREKFGNKWIDEKYSYLHSLQKRGLLYINNDIIQLTSKGYALCDEILEKIL